MGAAEILFASVQANADRRERQKARRKDDLRQFGNSISGVFDRIDAMQKEQAFEADSKAMTEAIQAAIAAGGSSTDVMNAGMTAMSGMKSAAGRVQAMNTINSLLGNMGQADAIDENRTMRPVREEAARTNLEGAKVNLDAAKESLDENREGRPFRKRVLSANTRAAEAGATVAEADAAFTKKAEPVRYQTMQEQLTALQQSNAAGTTNLDEVERNRRVRTAVDGARAAAKNAGVSMGQFWSGERRTNYLRDLKIEPDDPLAGAIDQQMAQAARMEREEAEDREVKNFQQIQRAFEFQRMQFTTKAMQAQNAGAGHAAAAFEKMMGQADADMAVGRPPNMAAMLKAVANDIMTIKDPWERAAAFDMSRGVIAIGQQIGLDSRGMLMLLQQQMQTREAIETTAIRMSGSAKIGPDGKPTWDPSVPEATRQSLRRIATTSLNNSGIDTGTVQDPFAPPSVEGGEPDMMEDF